ncbi:sigma-70 family RNA polymerase sigma factor [Candidatus Dojkabacteria bacterium]|uniref:Sigma-70 family RNA polymerase sigma factor n=1 Tax=Candidatus Dojkabacteria bacterium TaxID=2099670 RepID=A0A955L9M5_9BACT|nr:sigma-70 family RNA polymerase sigma factor [Candidatus Dojkabacteria bacterium]
MDNKDLLTKSYSDYAPEIFRFCMFKLNNREEAEDITSEAFIKLHEQNIAEINNVRAWLYKVSRNLIYDGFVRPVAKNLVEFTDMNANEETINNSLKSLEKDAIDSETIEIVKIELKNLDDTTADIISMKVWGDMSFNEIAQATDLKESAVKMRFYRGVDELKDSVNTKGSNIKAITIPILLAGILGISTQPAYAFTAASSVAVATAVGSTLGFTLTNMVNTNIAGSATVAGTGILATTAAKLIAGSAVLVAGAGVGIGAVAIQSNVPNQPENEIVGQNNTTSENNSEVNDAEVKAYSSDRYNLSFDYPKLLGETSIGFHPEYFNSESIGFTNSGLSISYPHFEGGSGCEVISENIFISNQQYWVCSWIQGVNKDKFGLMIQNSGPDVGVSNTITLMYQNLESIDQVNEQREIMELIISTMKYDFSSRTKAHNDSIISGLESLGSWDKEEQFWLTDNEGNSIYGENIPTCTDSGLVFSKILATKLKTETVIAENTTKSVTDYLESQGYSICMEESYNRGGVRLFEKEGNLIYMTYSAGGSAVNPSTPSVEVYI